jgi:hypothetical protein
MGNFSASFYIKDYLSINDTAYLSTEFAGDLIHFNTLDSNGYRRYYYERKITIEIPDRPIIHGVFDNFMHAGNPFIHVPVFSTKNQANFIFKQDTIRKFNRDIIRVSFEAKETEYSDIGTFFANAYYGNLFIDAESFAIILIEINIDYDPNGWVNNEQFMSKQWDIETTDFKNFRHNEFSEKYKYFFMQQDNGLYYNVYNVGELLIDETDLTTEINYVYKKLYNNLIYDYKQGKKPIPVVYKMDWRDPDIPYNPEFWDNFIAPVGDEVKTDLD